MVVNLKKTQLLCFSSSIHSDVSLYICPDGVRIESQEEMVLLGFKFGRRPTVAAHMDLIRKEVSARAWMVRHLKQAGVPDLDIVGAYASAIRPVIKYASPVYHPILSRTQSDELERFQRWILVR